MRRRSSTFPEPISRDMTYVAVREFAQNLSLIPPQVVYSCDKCMKPTSVVRFAVGFAIDTTFKQTGERTTITKLDLYTVRDGKVVRDEVCYDTPPGPSVR